MTRDNWEASVHLAEILVLEGKSADAVSLVEEAARKHSDTDVAVLTLLGTKLADFGANEAAAETLSRALRTKPQSAALYNDRGKIMAAMGNWQAALADHEEAARLSPETASYRYYLAHALAKKGNAAEAKAEYARASRLDPRWPVYAAAKAWEESADPDPAKRNGALAVERAEIAIGALGERAELLVILAAALAETGRFEEAVATAERAAGMALANKQTDLASQIHKQCDMYRQRQPCRDTGSG